MWLINILVFLLILSLLVMVHELGHFLAAKKMGVKVEEFGMGLPPKLFGIKKGETLYSLNTIPFGGFVRLLGENGESPVKAKDKGRTLESKSLRAQAFIVCAGVLMNFLMSFLLLCFGFWIGMEPLVVDQDDFLEAISDGLYEMESLPMDGDEASLKEAYHLPALFYQGDESLGDFFQKGDQLTYVNDQRVFDGEDLERILLEGRVNRREIFDFQGLSREGEILWAKNVWLPGENPVIFQVIPDSFAENAGLLVGDEIVSVNQERTFSADQVIESIQKDSDAQVELQIYRDGEEKTIFTGLNEEKKIGVALSDPLDQTPELGFYQGIAPYRLVSVHKQHYGIFEAPKHVVPEMVRLSGLSIQAFVQVMGNFLTFQEVPEGVTGPVGIAQLTAVSVSEGFSSVIRLIALLSLSLGVMNILPIPALDGGRLFFILFEVLTGRKPNKRLEALIHSVGFILLLGFIGFLTFHDIVSIL